MNLFKETVSFWAWFFQVIRIFLRVNPVTTLSVISMAAVSRVTSLLAFFIPLKVILLAGSSGVPVYFQFLVKPEHKAEWIVILAVVAVVFYAISIMMEFLTERLSLQGSEQVLRQAQLVPILNNQHQLAQSYYDRFCRLCADTLFAMTGIVAGLFVSFQLFLFFGGSILALFVLSAFLARSSDHSTPGIFGKYIRDNLVKYVSILSTLVFLASFIVLLLPFLLSGYGNILAAILSIIIIRQVLNALVATVRSAAALAAARHRIDVLVFSDVHFQREETSEDRLFRKLFQKPARRQMVKQELEKVMPRSTSLSVTWEDSFIPGVATFSVRAVDDVSAEENHFSLQVFAPTQLQKLEHEKYLFANISRSRLMAPDILARFSAGPFQCQLCQSGSMSQVPTTQWARAQKHLICHLWSCEPPAPLVETLCASTPPIHQRLNEDILSSLNIALDARGEKRQFETFINRLPRIRERMGKLPLQIYNPDLNRNTVAVHGDDFFVMAWGRWSLEPLGVGMPFLEEDEIAGIMDMIREKRSDIAADLQPKDILLASQFHSLEHRIKNRRYKAALDLIGAIVESGPFQPSQVGAK